MFNEGIMAKILLDVTKVGRDAAPRSDRLLIGELGIERVTLYRYAGPNGELRNYGKRVPGLA